MKLFNLRSDPKEETDIKDANPWVPSAIGKIVNDFWATVDKYPLIPVGTPDPYQPPAGAGTPAPRPPSVETVTTPSGLSYVFTKQGTGPRPQPGDVMVIHGIGRFPDGKEFWNTRTDGVPYEYTPGVDRVIRGFEEGMREVREGDRIVITMKPSSRTASAATGTSRRTPRSSSTTRSWRSSRSPSRGFCAMASRRARRRGAGAGARALQLQGVLRERGRPAGRSPTPPTGGRPATARRCSPSG